MRTELSLKAKIVNDVAAYKWSSYSEYVENAQLVDKAYALNMLSDQSDEAKGRFVQFLRETNSDVCLEIPEVKTNVDDDTLRQRVRQQIGVDAIATSNEEREIQYYILRELKGMDDTNIGYGKSETKSLSLCFYENKLFKCKKRSTRKDY